MRVLLSRCYIPISLIFLFVTATAIRVTNILTRGSLWLDELFTYHFSQFPQEALSLPFRYETNPPLSFLIPRVWSHGLSLDETFFLRFPSLVFGIAAIYLTYHLGRKVHSPQTGILAASMLTLSGVHIIISGELRIYSWLVFLVLISVGFFYLLVLRTNEASHRWWWLFAACQLLLLYSHLTALIIIIGECLVLTVTRPARPIMRRYLLSLGAAMTLFIPWFLYAALQKLAGIGSGAWYFSTPGNALTHFVTPFVGMTPGYLLQMVIGLMISMSVFYHMRKITRGHYQNERILILVMALLPLIASTVLGVFVPRYVAIAYPFLFIMVSWSIVSGVARQHVRIALSTGILLSILPTTWQATQHVISDWEDGTAYLTAQVRADDVIIADLNSTFSLYAYTALDEQIIPILLTKEPFSSALIKHNWHNTTVTDSTLREWLVNTVFAQSPEAIFLVYTDPSIARIATLLERDAWQIDTRYRLPGSFPVHIERYYVTNRP